MKIKQLLILKELFEKIPSIGSKTATRHALYIINNFNKEDLDLFKKTLEEIKYLKKCRFCNIISETDTCINCIENKKTDTLIIVSSLNDLEQLNNLNKLNFNYYILNCLIDLKNGIDDISLDINKLLNYIKNNNFKEVIFCLSSTDNGMITKKYIINKISELNLDIKLTSLAFGIPFGTDLKYADIQTLTFALENRKIIK